MSSPNPTPARPKASDAERWEYIIVAGTNRPPVALAPASRLDMALGLIASPQALVFLSVVLAVVVLAPQTPGAHNWAAERAAQQATQSVTGTGAGLAP